MAERDRKSICPWCEAEISPTVRKCRHCGEWVRGDPSGGSRQEPANRFPRPVTHPGDEDAPASHSGTVHAHGGTAVVRVENESVLFAVITLIFWILFAPIGFILNIVGLFTGPRRGCFGLMFFIFFTIPVVLIVVLAGAGIGVGIPIADEIIGEISRILPW